MLVDMAVHESRGNVKIKDVSKRQGVSVKYLEQIVSILSGAGYVRGERGPQGGYRLGVPPENITAGMVVRLMEGTEGPAPCIRGPGCERTADCVTKELWERVDRAVYEVLDSTTVADLAKKAIKNSILQIEDSSELRCPSSTTPASSRGRWRRGGTRPPWSSGA